MKKSRFTDSQIMDALKRVEAGLAVPDLCRELGISTETFYKWRSKYGGMDVSLIARMKELEAENARLRKMYVEEKIKAEIVAEALAKKDCGHLAGARWPCMRCPVEACRSGWHVRRSGSARLAIGTSRCSMPRTTRLRTGCCV
ncbi:transposase IS3/IS911 family protein [Burkholderia ambifaria MEX-5]|uniref:Transposase IS3/IS911 family protein n=1 Tax=Burkholderia ambifaria MEX-5 TaxID=396597 RepID=B1T1Z7_9BURK|nr:transposase IS3/IS911 family protein [Burkholderia ambifaria MEX-5]